MNQISLQNQNFQAGFDPEKGTLRTLRMVGDELGTEFIGSEANISYPSILKGGQRLGDWKIVLWDRDADSWKEELTSRSGDIRRVHEDENAVTVSYRGRSSAPGGISDFELEQRFEVDGEVMRWTAKLTNPKDVPVEFGEISLPFLTNTDFSGIFTDEKYRDEENWRGVKQRLWHEQRVQQHLCVTGNSSYAYLQRPKGDYPGLLFQVADDTALEVAYQMDPNLGDQFSIVFEGPYYLSLYSWAAVSRGGWNAAGESNRYWFNGNTSLVLGPGMSKEFHFVFSRIDRESRHRAAAVPVRAGGGGRSAGHGGALRRGSEPPGPREGRGASGPRREQPEHRFRQAGGRRQLLPAELFAVRAKGNPDPSRRQTHESLFLRRRKPGRPAPQACGFCGHAAVL